MSIIISGGFYLFDGAKRTLTTEMGTKTEFSSLISAGRTTVTPELTLSQ